MSGRILTLANALVLSWCRLRLTYRARVCQLAYFVLRWADWAASDHRCDPTPAIYTAVMGLDVDGASPRLRLHLSPRLQLHLSPRLRLRLAPRLRLRLAPPAPTRTRSESRCILPPLTQTNSRLPSQSPPARRGRPERAGVDGPCMCYSGLPVTPSLFKLS